MKPVVSGVAISILVLACAACAPEDQSADTHPFVDEYERKYFRRQNIQ